MPGIRMSATTQDALARLAEARKLSASSNVADRYRLAGPTYPHPSLTIDKPSLGLGQGRRMSVTGPCGADTRAKSDKP
jgi:hypothetical protein